MLVNLRKDFFGPNNALYLARDNPHDFPTNWEDSLPKGAEVVGRGIVGSEDYKADAKLPKVTVSEADADDPKVDGLSAGNKPLDATAIVAGTEHDNSNLTTAEADKVKEQLEKAAQEGTAPVGARPDKQPAEAAAEQAKTGSTPPKK